MEQEQYAVEMHHISKSFASIYALQDVDFMLQQGEIHALLGENGAGKSTLMKILSGAYTKDQGEIRVNGEPAHITGPASSKKLGISTIYQEFNLADDLTVAENIFIDDVGNGSAFINWKELFAKAKSALSELGFTQIDVRKKVGRLSVAYKQIVEICKALTHEAKVLVFDEPTAVLASSEVEALFRLIRKLNAGGVSIIYISHRLEEIFELCDRVSVLKDGKNVTTVQTSAIDKSQLVALMIGRDLSAYYPERSVTLGDTVLRVENLNAGRQVRDVSFDVRAGEILGVSGLVGAGRTETMRAVFGADPKESGKVFLNNREVRLDSPEAAVENGVCMVPEDRKSQGVLLHLPIQHNITIAFMRRFASSLGWIFSKKETEAVKRMVSELQIKIPGRLSPVSSLSGGNQQKVAVAKWLLGECRVLILDEPTRGVDVGAKVEIYRIMNQLAAKGVSIIMISSEMPEIIGMSDRVLVMRDGCVAGQLEKDEINELNLIKLSMGVQE